MNYARGRITDADEALPAAPEDCAAVVGYLCAFVPEYELDRQANVTDDTAGRADRKQAVLSGFRKARRAKPAAPLAGTDGDGNSAPEAV